MLNIFTIVVFGKKSLKKMINLTKEQDLYFVLKNSNKPLIMYGTGNGADKIIEEFEKRNLTISDFFASNSFVRERYFHGKKVLSLDEVKKKYPDFIIILGFGSSLPDVIDYFFKLDDEYEMYAPDVPISGDIIFDYNYYINNIDEFNKVRNLFSDEESKRIFDNIICYKITGKIKYLKDSISTEFTSLLPNGFTHFCDMGAYNGDTIESYTNEFPKIKNVIAFEPSEKIYNKMLQKIKEYPNIDFHPYNCASWDIDCNLSFVDGAARNSTVSETNCKEKSGAKLKTVSAKALDNVIDFKNKNLLIKYDVEGAEEKSLYGSRKAIMSNNTSLVVSSYHRSDDFLILPKLIKALIPECKLYMRKTLSIPCWDISLIASNKNVD